MDSSARFSCSSVPFCSGYRGLRGTVSFSCLSESITEQVKILKEKLGIPVEEEDDEEDEVEDFDEDNHDDFFPKGYGTLEKKDNKNNENNDEEG